MMAFSEQQVVDLVPDVVDSALPRPVAASMTPMFIFGQHPGPISGCDGSSSSGTSSSTLPVTAGSAGLPDADQGSAGGTCASVNGTSSNYCISCSEQAGFLLARNRVSRPAPLQLVPAVPRLITLPGSPSSPLFGVGNSSSPRYISSCFSPGGRSLRGPSWGTQQQQGAQTHIPSSSSSSSVLVKEPGRCSFAAVAGMLAAAAPDTVSTLAWVIAQLLFWCPGAFDVFPRPAAAAAVYQTTGNTALLQPAPAAVAEADADAADGASRLLQLPFALLQRIAQHLLEGTPSAAPSNSSSTRSSYGPSPSVNKSSSSSSSSSALQELSCTCLLLRQVVLATLPQLSLRLQQLLALASCQQAFSSAAVVTLEVKPQSNTGQTFSSMAAGQQTQEAAAQQGKACAGRQGEGDAEAQTAATGVVPYAQVLSVMPQALARLPYVRHVQLRGLSGGLLPLLQPLQQLPHLQELTLQGRRGRLPLLPAVLAHAQTTAAVSAAQHAKPSHRVSAAGASDQAASSSTARAPDAQHGPAHAATAVSGAKAAPTAAVARGSYRDAIMGKPTASSNSSSSSSNNARASSSPGTGTSKVQANSGCPDPSISSSSSSNGAASGQQLMLGSLSVRPVPPPPLHDLSCLRKLTLRRVNLGSIRYSITTTSSSSSSSSSSGSSGRSGSSSSSRSFCPLSLLVQHLTQLQSLSLQHVGMDRGSLASLSGAPAGCSQPGSCTGLRLNLQELNLSSVKQQHLELHHVSALTSLTALRLANLRVRSGPSSSTRTQPGFWGDSASELDSEDEEGSESDVGGEWEPDAAVQQLLLQGLGLHQADAEPQQEQQQQQQQQQQPCVTTAAAAAVECNLTLALANLTNLSVLSVTRVPALLNSSGSSGSTGSNAGGYSSASRRSSGSSEALPGALGALSKLSSLQVPLWLLDTQLPGAWASWSTGLVTLQVATLMLTSHWAPLPPLAALQDLTVTNLLQAPAGFLAGFAPNLKRLSVGVIAAAEPLPASAAVRGSSSGGGRRGSNAAAAAEQQLVGLAAVAAGNVLEELVLLNCSFGSTDPASSAGGAAVHEGQAHFGGVPDGAVLEPPPPAAAAPAAPAAVVTDVAAAPLPGNAATAAAAGAGSSGTGSSSSSSSSGHWASLGARASAIDWDAVDVSGGMAALAAMLAVGAPGSQASGAAVAGAAAAADGGQSAAGVATGVAALPPAAADMLGSALETAAEVVAAVGQFETSVAEVAAAAAAEGGAAAAAASALQAGAVAMAAAAAEVQAMAAEAAALAAAAAAHGAAAAIGSDGGGSGAAVVVVPCAADVRALTVECRGVRRLQLEKLEAGCSLVTQLPRVLSCWHRLADLRLHNVVNSFGDADLASIVGHHASSLQHLSLSACRGITWAGVAGLKAAGGLRSLRLAQLYPVTIASVIEAVGSMAHLTSLTAEGLSAGWSATKVIDNKPLADHLATAFAVGRYWATYTAIRDGEGVTGGDPPHISTHPPYFRGGGGFNPDYWEFYSGPADEAAVRAAAPQLVTLSVRD